MENAVKTENKTLTDRARVLFQGFARLGAGFLLKLGLRPNTVTVAGLAGHFAAGYLVAIGQLTWGGILLLVMAPLDFLDGTMARMRGESSRFGAFVDSTTDRYSEFVIMGALCYYFVSIGNWMGAALSYLSIVGSIMVSYTRARGEGLGFDVKVGMLSRMERYIILIPGIVFHIPIVAVWLIAIFANFTALQRIFYVRRQAYTEMQTQPTVENPVKNNSDPRS